jgi:hypothetical protein
VGRTYSCNRLNVSEKFRSGHRVFVNTVHKQCSGTLFALVCTRLNAAASWSSSLTHVCICNGHSGSELCSVHCTYCAANKWSIISSRYLTSYLLIP